MCRFAAYLGPTAPLSGLLYDPPRSLHEQAYAPHHQHDGNVNVDGTGVTWWDGEAPEPLRYVTDRPPWSDPNLPTLASRLRAGVQLAAVRGATPGMPLGATAAAPFTRGIHAGVHNGKIARFDEGPGRALTEPLPDELYTLDALSDSHVLFLTIVAAWLDDPDAGLTAAVTEALRRVAHVCNRFGVAATLTVAVADGQRCVAARAAIDAPANSLFTLEDGERWPGAVLIASEPLDEDRAWRPVAPGCVVEATTEGTRAHDLPDLKGMP